MTKSGIGTLQPPSNMSLINNTSTTPTQISSSALIANAEIPIWVADKKKWVTGISKKTTINDLIFAILKQCQINAPHRPNEGENSLQSMQYVLVEYNFEPSSQDTITTTISEQVVLTSQRVLNGDSKVYKFLAKWSFSGQQPVQQSNNLMLKILQRQAYEEQNTDSHCPAPAPTSLSFNNTNDLHKNTSLATKLLKKFGVSSSSSSGSSGVLPNQVSKCSSSDLPNTNTTTTPAFRYVDVKLPTTTGITTQVNNTNKSFDQISPTSTTSSTSLTKQSIQRNFDPNVQKSFVTNSILEKDNKLKQQINRFQLIDELIKETEKKSKSSGMFESPSNQTTGFLSNPTYNYSPPLRDGTNYPSPATIMNTTPVEITNLYDNSTSKQSNALNVIDLNDVYCHFPEMSTHHLKEVEDFTLMCSQLFQLEEAIKSQKHILSSLEGDLQRELQPNANQATFLADNLALQSVNETPESRELKKEVNYSREQTRLQCKQLHDLDMCMKQNEQSLMGKEQELQQLLEELYIQEIYADSAIESGISGGSNRPVTPSGQVNMSTFKLSGGSASSTVNNLMSQLHGDSVMNLTGGGGGLPMNETVDSFGDNNENNCTQERVELIINERNSFNSSNIDFIQIQQQKRIAMENTLENQTKRQIRIFNELNDAQVPTNTNDQTKQPHSLKILNQTNQYITNNGQHQLQSQHKSLSYGNLAGVHSTSTHNLYPTSPVNSPQNNTNTSSLKKCQTGNNGGNHPYNNNQDHELNHSHSINSSMKNLVKMPQQRRDQLPISVPQNQFINVNGSNSNSNGDHSGGDNDSGISSMSSETAAAMNSNLAAGNSFNFIQKPIIMGQQAQRCLILNGQGQQSHQVYNQHQQGGYTSQQGQYFVGNRQIYGQNGNGNGNNNNNQNLSVNSKTVLETLV